MKENVGQKIIVLSAILFWLIFVGCFVSCIIIGLDIYYDFGTVLLSILVGIPVGYLCAVLFALPLKGLGIVVKWVEQQNLAKSQTQSQAANPVSTTPATSSTSTANSSVSVYSWTCPSCGARNPLGHHYCSVCFSSKPKK